MAINYDMQVARCGAIPAGAPAVIPTNTIEYSASFSQVPTLGFKASALLSGALPDGTEIRVRLFDGTIWTEPEHGRYVIFSSSVDEADPTLMTSYTTISWPAYLLAKAVLRSADGSDREWNDATPGLLLDHVFDEARARGWTDGEQLGWNFTALNDSNGDVWSAASKTTLPFEADQTYLQLVQALSDGGVMDWTTRGRELIARNPGAGPDLTGGPTPVFIARQATSRPVRTSIANAADAITMRAKDGTGRVFEGPRSIPSLGRLESAFTASGVDDQKTLGLLGELELVRGRPQTMLTVTESIKALDHRPLIDYPLGSWVNVRRIRAGVWEPSRVLEVQLRKDSNGTISADIVLQSRIASSQERLERRAASIGASASGNGRARTGSGSGAGSSMRYGTISDTYAGGGAPARVQFEGSTELSEPLAFLASYQPARGDSVAVGRVGGAGDVIFGRVTSAGSGNPGGSAEVLDPGEGWDEWDVDRYGPPTVRRTASDWVILSGALKKTAGSATVFVLPGSYRPARPDGIVFMVRSGDSEGSGIEVPLRFDPSTGAVTLIGAAPEVLFLDGIQFNIRTTGISGRFGRDVYGTSYAIGQDAGGTGTDMDVLYRPSINTTAIGASVWRAGYTTVRFIVGADGRFEGPLGGIDGRTNWAEGSHWPSSAAAYSWTTLSLINGFVHTADNPLQWAKAPDGVVFLRGSASGGIFGQIMAQLPAGARPSFEHGYADGYRVTAGGNIVAGSTGATINCMFVAGR